MATRLDRLFILLESGGSAATREAAARQLGDVVKAHPQDLTFLLSRLFKCCRNHSWETRVACGQAASHIGSNVPQWNPIPVPGSGGAGNNASAMPQWMSLKSFDPKVVLEKKRFLMASKGSEYAETTQSSEAQERMMRKTLGLEIADKIGVDTSHIISSEDLKQEYVPAEVQSFNGDVATDLGLKRPAQAEVNGEPHPTKRVKVEGDEEPLTAETGPKSWPFQAFCDTLSYDLFSPVWEVRHGAATVLREVIRVHGSGAGKVLGASCEEMAQGHDSWLEDIALKLICVLLLDRFGDFVSDQVVAPVKETAAQALSWVCYHQKEEHVEAVMQVLIELLKEKEWQVRHGGLLGIKYIFAARDDLQEKLVPSVFEQVFECLQDSMDDVAAAAANALVPIASRLLKALPEQIPKLLTTLWDALQCLDDLTSATNSVITLLSSLLSHYDAPAEGLPLNELVRRLWPFMAHSSANVRKATLETLIVLTSKLPEKEGADWIHTILSEAICFTYMRALVETLPSLHKLIFKLWRNLINRTRLTTLVSSTCTIVSGLLCLAMTQSHVVLDLNLLGPDMNAVMRSVYKGTESLYLGGSEKHHDSFMHRSECAMQCRLLAARLLGLLSGAITIPLEGVVYHEPPSETYAQILASPLNARSAYGRTVVALVTAEWLSQYPDSSVPDSLVQCFHQCLTQCLYYDEIAVNFTRLQQGVRDLVASLLHHNAKIPTEYSGSAVLTLQQIEEFAKVVESGVMKSLKVNQKRRDLLEDQRLNIQKLAQQTIIEQESLTLLCNACIAEAVAWTKNLPEKLNPLIRPLMETIRKQSTSQLQNRAACALAMVLKSCAKKDPCPNAKVVKNLITYLCSGSVMPNLELQELPLDREKLVKCTKSEGILKLLQHQVSAEQPLKRQDSGMGSGKLGKAAPESEATTDSDDSQYLQVRGAELAIRSLASEFGENLPKDLPPLWEAATEFSSLLLSDPITDEIAHSLLRSLRVFEVLSVAVHENLHEELVRLCKDFMKCLSLPFTAVRHMAARCLSTFASVKIESIMNMVLDILLELLNDPMKVSSRQGAVEAIASLIDRTGLKLVPYVPILILPILGQMSDNDVPTRLMSSQCFASLVQLMPFHASAMKNSELPKSQMHSPTADQKNFLEQLLNPSLMKSVPVPKIILAELRKYQQEGLNWLGFLQRYKLHGILCDDMGLGKTLQAICIMASEYENPKTKDSLPSLIICPPTVTGHWIYEIKKFIANQLLKPLHYSGPPTERQRLRAILESYNIVVASYDIVRNDIEFFSSIKWKFCILDEGHMIKNGKTKLSKAVKKLDAAHRLILSGTPIQNNVLELWSLFDFLMPGFLGTEKEFTARYSKPILQSRDAKSSSQEQQAGILALEALHRQVLPFLLRRIKQDVLEDLPPKITQDYYCELSPLQQKLYEDFSRSRAQQHLCDTAASDLSQLDKTDRVHVFQALQYLKKVCNHPKLVLSPEHPEWGSVISMLRETNSDLDDINHSAKLQALRQLLLDCGIGCQDSGAGDVSVVSQHRVLIFFQLKAMLDIVEKTLLKKCMPEVSYMRLDGSTPAGQRHDVVHRFNSDPSIDVLLLTTQVGGLGLNLTGADTVIFVEHDWNPMKDLQAMDRAHRIGQKKVVNVYRLITRGTLEEKIMGLQKFKLATANTVITQDNASLQTMGTEQLLDLFTFNGSKAETSNDKGESNSKGGLKVVLENLPDLWDESQYENEYSMESFMKSLQTKA
ncbi:unnamed protein product [Darwinula stevensoni]|uniref:TATA-binding protein-associated factor 172 n=1 Tax=Darwinula stevensoni TaxID=69355 RepID=A0A7R8XE08_9CRUS|nr:unnamed protein product [Darwinula stevensoni]CAG0889106.1 unnamed protein product [Darwinula stevensoni]